MSQDESKEDMQEGQTFSTVQALDSLLSQSPKDHEIPTAHQL